MARQRKNERGADCRIGMCCRIGGHVECVGQEPVADENGGCLVIGLMRRRPAAAQIVIVERRKIVVDQRIAMDHFKCGRGAQHAFALDAEKPRRFDHQKRAQALAAAKTSHSAWLRGSAAADRSRPGAAQATKEH